MQAPKNSRSLDTYLKSAKELERLAAHAEKLGQLQRIYAQIAPTYLATASQVANFRSGKVVIHAANGAVAAKLKQLEPSLRGDFYSNGVEVTEISIKAQGGPPDRAADRPPADRALSSAGSKQIEALAGQLPADSSLRAALQRLLHQSRHRR
jgi:hypothetical protein